MSRQLQATAVFAVAGFAAVGAADRVLPPGWINATVGAAGAGTLCATLIGTARNIDAIRAAPLQTTVWRSGWWHGVRKAALRAACAGGVAAPPRRGPRAAERSAPC